MGGGWGTCLTQRIEKLPVRRWTCHSSSSWWLHGFFSLGVRVAHPKPPAAPHGWAESLWGWGQVACPRLWWRARVDHKPSKHSFLPETMSVPYSLLESHTWIDIVWHCPAANKWKKENQHFFLRWKHQGWQGWGVGSVGRRIPGKAEKHIGYAFKDKQCKREEDVFLLLGQHLNRPWPQEGRMPAWVRTSSKRTQHF